MTATTLFQADRPPSLPAAFDAPVIGKPHVSPYRFRDYQTEDADALMAAWNRGARGVVCRWSTGLGKSILAAEVCRRMIDRGRVLAVVDVGSLARDLFSTIRKHTGIMPASLTGASKTNWKNARIVVATIQSMYAGGKEHERFREFRPAEWAAIVCDENETSIAERYSETLRWFIDGNPDLKYVGMSATPFRTDKRGMIEMYDHAADQPGPLNRDILWSVMNGWLVKPRQGFVRCSLDFSTLKVRKNATTGEKDYSEDDISKLMMDQDERQWRQMAEAIFKASDGRQSIVMCPNNIEVAKLVAYHIDGAANQPRIAFPIFGKQGELAHDLIAEFKRKEFRFAVSCQMLCLDSETEILTTSGWRHAHSIKKTDKVANWEYSGRVYFEKPKKIIRRMLGENEAMISAVGRMVNLRVTECHKLITRKTNGFIKRQAWNLVGQRQLFPVCGIAEPLDVTPSQPCPLSHEQRKRAISANSFVLRKGGLNSKDSLRIANERLNRRQSLLYRTPKELTLNDCRFIGFWVGDGNRATPGGGVHYSICQSVVYPKIIAWFDDVISQMGIDFKRHVHHGAAAKKAGINPSVHWYFSRGTGFGPQQRRGVFHLEPYLDKQGSHLLWGLNQLQFDALLEGYWMADGLHGDGTRNHKRQLVLCDTKKSWIDLLQAIGCVRGYRTSQSFVRRQLEHHNDQYALRMIKGSVAGINKNCLKIESGLTPEPVWCVETSSGNIITRRFGKVAVMGNSKGFDDEWTQCAFMLRKTKSRRIYEQFLGRVVRPPTAIREALNNEPDPAKRREIVANSTKPYAVLYDLVGVHPDAKDLGVIDVLGDKLSDKLREKTKQNMLTAGEIDGEHDVGAEAREAQGQLKKETEAAARHAAEEAERRKRAAVHINSLVQIDMSDDLGVTSTSAGQRFSRGGTRLASVKQIRLLIAFGVAPEAAHKYSIKQAGAVISSYTEKNAKPVWRRLNDWEWRQQQAGQEVTA